MPAEWLQSVPPQLLERLAALIDLNIGPSPIETASMQASTNEVEAATERPHEPMATPTIPHIQNDPVDDDEYDSSVLPPTFSLWPQHMTEASSSSSAAPSTSSLAALLSNPPPPPPNPPTPPASSTPDSASLPMASQEVPRGLPRANWQDVDAGMFEGRTFTTRQIALPWPWRGKPREDFTPRHRGYWPWNDVRKRITAFRNRVQGPYPGVMSLQRGKWTSMEDFVAAGGIIGLNPPVHVHHELPVLCEWLAARQLMAARITSVEVVPPLTTEIPPGTWVRAALRPSGPTTTPKGPYNHVGYHGTSMNNLNRTVVHGIQQGWSCIGEGTAKAVEGIYLHAEDAVDLCLTYALYTPLQETGYYYAPYLQVRYAYHPEEEWRPHKAKKAGRATQYVTYPDVSYMSAVYFHVLAAADMLYGDKAHWINVEPERPADMEIPIALRHSEVAYRSQRSYLQAKLDGMAPENSAAD